MLCYGLFGFGYIVPATFLPAMAREAVPNPAIFGWVWPIFGLAALLSALAAGRWSAVLSNRFIWGGGHLVMAVGVAVPLLQPGIAGIIIASLCVGSTVMVVTLAGLQEARRVAPTHSARLIAAMTAAFAAGQMLGPVFIGLFGHEQRGLHVSLSVASVALVLSATALLVSGSQEHKRERDRRAGPGRIEGACKQT